MSKTKKYSLRERFNSEELYQRYLSFSTRERIFALLGMVLVVFLLLLLPYSCASSKLNKMRKQVVDYEKDVSAILSRIENYKKIESQLSQEVKNIRPESETQLRAKIESVANEMGITTNSIDQKEGVKSEEYEERVATVRASRLPLSQVIEFLNRLEQVKDMNLKVQRLEVSPRYDDRQQFDLNFDVRTLISVASSGNGSAPATSGTNRSGGAGQAGTAP